MNSSPGTRIGIAEREHLTEEGVLLDDDLAARLQMRIVGDLVEAQRGTERDVVLDRDLHPFVLRLRVEHLLDLAAQRVVAAGEVDDEIGAVLAQEILAADRGAPVLPELRLDRTEEDVLAVGGLVVLVLGGFAGGLPVPAPVDELGVQHREGVEPLRVEHRVGARHVEVAPFAGQPRACQRARHAERGVQRTDHDAAAAPDRVTGRDHEAVVVERHRRRTAPERVHHLAVRRHVGVRTRRAEAGGLAVHDLGPDGADGLLVEPQLPVGVADVAGDEDVGAVEQPGQHLAAFGGAGVAGEAALVAVQREVERGPVGGEPGHDVAEVVTLTGGLDLHDVGALVAEEAAEVVDRHQHPRLDDGHTLEQAGHASGSFAASGRAVVSWSPGAAAAGRPEGASR